MRTPLAWPLALLLLAGCPIGTSAAGYQPAQGPAGAAIELELKGGTKLNGELLTLERDSLLLLNRKRRLVRVAIASLQNTRAPKASHRGPDIPEETREKLRLISRYPQGVSSELEQRLLEAYGQTAVEVAP